MRRIALLVAGMALLACVVAAVSGGATKADAQWVVTDLGTLGGKESEATAINERGQIVGSADTRAKDRDGYSVSHAIRWQSGGMHDLGTLPRFRHCRALDINERRDIVGRCENEALDSRAVLWRGKGVIDLGLLKRPGYRFANAEASLVNECSQVVGSSWEGLDGAHSAAFTWVRGATIDLGGLGGEGIDTEATAINERGEIVGGAWADSGLWHAFLWRAGTMVDLGASGKSGEALALNARGQAVGWSGTSPALWEDGKLLDLKALPARRYGQAVAISEDGSIVGWSSATVDDDRHARSPRATLWRNGRRTDLRSLPGTHFSQAVAINDRGQIVGWSATRLEFGEPRDPRAFVWQGGKMTHLGTLGGRLSQAVAINNHGQIVGWAETKDGNTHAALWTLKRG
jgi:probable HAF family extracellular repeat protein